MVTSGEKVPLSLLMASKQGSVETPPGTAKLAGATALEKSKF